MIYLTYEPIYQLGCIEILGLLWDLIVVWWFFKATFSHWYRVSKIICKNILLPKVTCKDFYSTKCQPLARMQNYLFVCRGCAPAHFSELLWGHLRSFLYSNQVKYVENLRNWKSAGCNVTISNPDIYESVRQSIRIRLLEVLVLNSTCLLSNFTSNFW